MDKLQIVFSFLTVIALILSSYLTIIEIRRRLYGLHLNISGITMLDQHSNTLYLLLHLTIFNPSSITRTIYQIEFQPQGDYRIVVVRGEQDLSQSLVTFRCSGSAGVGVRMRYDDVAYFPLDIEPLHSKTALLAVALSPAPTRPLPASETLDGEIFGYFLAFDYRKKQIARLRLQLPT
jgi:hypothetical protein